MKRHHKNNDYVNTHAKDPRGFGAWMFAVDVYSVRQCEWVHHEILGATDTFARARKQVQDQALLEARTTFVGPVEVHTETLG